MEERIGNEGRARFGKLRDIELYREVRRQGGFAFPPLPTPVLRVDTDELTAPEAAAAICSRLATLEAD